MLPLIGQITLNLSLIFYLFWFVPQLWLNFQRRSTQGLSLWMHGILCLGFLSDLFYGFGREMAWQYRLVTIVGLLSLAIQHYQFFHYGLKAGRQKHIFIALSLIYLFLLAYAIFAITAHYHTKDFYIVIGFIAQICWMTYALPQIYENYLNKSTIGLSIGFVWLGIFIKLCDITSAWTLHWDYPNKIGSIALLLLGLILLLQIFYYGKPKQLVIVG